MHRSKQREIVLESLPSLLAQGEVLAGEFHRRLFESRPDLRPIFPKEEKAREQNLMRLLDLLKASATSSGLRRQTHTSISKDPLLSLALWSRPGGPLQAASATAYEDAKGAFVDAVSATLDHCSAEQRDALALMLTGLSRAQRVMSQVTVHASGIRDKKKKNALVLSAEFDQDLEPRDLLEALNLCDQHLRLSFTDDQDASTGSLLLHSGQVLEAECQQEGGQPAFRLLMARPHHRVRISRSSSRAKGAGLGALMELLEEPRETLPKEIVDPSRPAANREPLAEELCASDLVEEEAQESELYRAGVPTPLTSAVPLVPLPRGTIDTQPINLDAWSFGDGKAQPFRPQELALSRVERPWVATLQKIPHLRALILLPSSESAQGSFWSRDGAEISIADLSRFGQAILWTQVQLPNLFGSQERAGWTNTTELALGCVVTTLDARGAVRICLFDAGTPLGKVRHTNATVRELSLADAGAGA